MENPDEQTAQPPWRGSAPFTVISTYTIDRVPMPDGGVKEVPGGPAYFMSRALGALGARFDIISGETAIVDVVRTLGGEEYVIPPLPMIPMPPRLSGTVLVSPVMREIDPEQVPMVDGLLAIDLQGFVREPGVPSGYPPAVIDLDSLLTRTDVVKAAVPELERLTDGSRRMLSRLTLVLTRGADGATIYAGSDVIDVESEPVDTDVTIGAGDTFFAVFIAALRQGAPLRDAGRMAARFTEAMLRTRADSAR